ncbi:Gfo/Idh/MocA family oxidoreductase [Candidatus Sumerlaeota bacterium]|nr:Gfo/Idh/MocA family oxidoreductase [Candidatus Sumerlaeota bacterium]
MFKVAVVGLGNAAHNLHLPALKGLQNVEIVGGCDLEEKRRSSAAATFGIKVFDSFATMLDSTKPEVVVIGTPPDSHFDYCKRSLEAGAHVICEKPFVSSLSEGDLLLEEEKKHGKRIALNHEFREMPIFRALRDDLGSPETGPLVFLQIWQLMNLPPWSEPGWRGRMLQRTLYEAGVHLVDYAMALFQEKPVAVNASTSTCGVREGETDAVALATLEFSRGRLAQITQNRLCKGDTQYFEVRAEGESASLRASYGGRVRATVGLLRSTAPHFRFDFGLTGVAWREQGTKRTPLARNPKNSVMIATRNLFERTLEAFEKGTRPPATIQDGIDVLEVIAACYHSSATGQRIRIDSEEMARLRSMRMGENPA